MENKYIVKFTTDQVKTLKQLFNLLNGYIKELNLIFTPDGIFINYHEALNISIKVEINNENNTFSEFYCAEPRCVGVNVSTISSVLKSISDNSDILFTFFIEKAYTANDNEKFGIIIFYKENCKTITINISIIDVNKDDVEDFEINYSCSIQMIAKSFSKDITIAKANSSEILQICYHDGEMTYITKCKNKADIVLNCPDIKVCSFNDKKNNEFINIYIKITKLIDIIKFSNISNVVVMYLKNNSSLILEYDISNMGKITFGIPNDLKPDDY